METQIRDKIYWHDAYPRKKVIRERIEFLL